jgi:protein-L-isoaspartate(D-aspartate) O-methyltransferase
MSSGHSHGIGMTSQRTRTRMIERLREKGYTKRGGIGCNGQGAAACLCRRGACISSLRRHRPAFGMGQTISQPFIVARMIELLLNGRQTIGKTLEVGAGCGYQAAVLAQLSSDVYAVERLGPLLEKAKSHMRVLCSNLMFV